MKHLLAVLAVVALLAIPAAASEPPRRALLIGISDYTASRLGAQPQQPLPPGRIDWPDLPGPVNDVATLRELLIRRHDFEERDIVTLTNQEATRAKILEAIDRHLVQTAAKGTITFFYYGGHGTQVSNTLSDEDDQLDEAIVPADSRLGALDIRDKELRRLFNQILDRGARLTIFLDTCNSASGARGLASGDRARSIKPDLRDIRDGRTFGPRPEDRGALVLAATGDSDLAWNTRDEDGTIRGAFTSAWMAALNEAPGEPAQETFLRARARLRAGKRYQEPVIAGPPSARQAPFLGTRSNRAAGGRTVIAVKEVRDDGTVILDGGSADGLTAGCELAVAGSSSRVVITAVRGLARSEARAARGRPLPQQVHSGALLEVVTWSTPPSRPLRVWMPRMNANAAAILALAKSLHAARRDIRWVTDPTQTTPAHVLRPTARGWELLGDSTSMHADPVAALAAIPAGASLFVQLPAPGDAIAIDGVEVVERSDDADYLLAGRYSAGAVAYAWVRPGAKESDRVSPPPRTKWTADFASLREDLLALRRIHGWNQLQSPRRWQSPYRLTVRSKRTHRPLAADQAIVGNDSYELVLRANAASLPQKLNERHYYAFAIDSDGKGILLFPAGAQGSVENRFPLDSPPRAEIALGSAGSFKVEPPYGLDTFFLLSTEEPLSTPWILEWDGLGTRSPANELERLLMLTMSGTRGTPIATPFQWSIEKVAFESVAPKKAKK